jgi:hypothetical protein
VNLCVVCAVSRAREYPCRRVSAVVACVVVSCAEDNAVYNIRAVKLPCDFSGENVGAELRTGIIVEQILTAFVCKRTGSDDGVKLYLVDENIFALSLCRQVLRLCMDTGSKSKYKGDGKCDEKDTLFYGKIRLSL